MPSRARVLACGIAGVVACAVAVALPTTTGCTTHQCDASSYDFSGGIMADATTWVSNEIDQPWLKYGPNTTVRIGFPPSVGRAPMDVEVYVGTGDEPNFGPDFQGGQNYTLATGQLAITNFLGPRGVWITNGTCADYFARVVVHFVAPSLVMFGGTSGAGSMGGAAPLGDTMTWNGSAWATTAPPAAPSPRSGAVMAALGEDVFLFGGRGPADGGAAQPLNDTWIWDGQTWTQLSPQASPPARFDAASGVETLAGSSKLVVFGGRGEGGGGAPVDLDDTWVWDGFNWSEQQPHTKPPARSGAVAGGLDDAVVMFGGSTGGGASLLGDTWTWREGEWTPAGASAGADAGPDGGTEAGDDASAGASSPPPRTHAAATSFGGQLLVFGGTGGQGPLDDTWLWNGSTWSEAATAAAPSPRASATIGVFGGAAVLFGGSDASGAALGDTWTWNGTTWTKQNDASAPGAPPPRAAAAMAAN